ncbi:hypothetical protein ACFV4X_26385 [Streptomyces ardesiacus]|uniref:hypothetical protein n=1 Tax=Streptomyces ardesiacus TaxID=285564 RepID=UPI00365675C4
MPLLEFTPEQAEALRKHMERAAAMWRRLAEVFREIARGLARTAMAVADFVQRQQTAPPAAGANPRPAWMSPYGPPQRGRHRRR